MSCLCNDSVFNICLGFVQLQVGQWCVKRAWINNKAKAIGIPPMHQPDEILKWVPVFPLACLCLRPEFKLLFLSSGVTFLYWPCCILKLVRTPSLVHEWYQWWCGFECGMKVREWRNARKPAFLPTCYHSALNSLGMGEVQWYQDSSQHLESAL